MVLRPWKCTSKMYIVAIYILSLLEAAKKERAKWLKQCRLSAGKRCFVPVSQGYNFWLMNLHYFFGHTFKLDSCRPYKNVRQAEDVTCFLRFKPHILKTILNIIHNRVFYLFLFPCNKYRNKSPWNCVNMARSFCINISQFECLTEHAPGIAVEHAPALHLTSWRSPGGELWRKSEQWLLYHSWPSMGSPPFPPPKVQMNPVIPLVCFALNGCFHPFCISTL